MADRKDNDGQTRRKVQASQKPPTVSTYSVERKINGEWEQDPMSPQKDQSRSDLVRHFGGSQGGPNCGNIRVRHFSTP